MNSSNNHPNMCNNNNNFFKKAATAAPTIATMRDNATRIANRNERGAQIVKEIDEARPI